MAELNRAQEEPHWTTNNLSNYHKGESIELQKAGTTQEVTKTPQEGVAPSSTQDPHANSETTRHTDPVARRSNKGAWPTTRPVTSVEGQPLQGGVLIRIHGKLHKPQELL